MLQLRLVDEKGRLDWASNEKGSIPLWYKPKGGNLSRAILADYCFNDKMAFFKFQKNVTLQDMAYVIYNTHNKPKELWLYGKKVFKNKEQILDYLLENCLFTTYDRTKRFPQSVTVFYLTKKDKAVVDSWNL